MNILEGLKVGNITKRLFIYALFICGVILLLYAFRDFLSHPTSEWRKESKLYTDNFLQLLKDDDYEELYRKYAADSDISVDVFKKELEKLNNVFGRIKSYNYRGASTSYEGGNRILTSFFIIYRMTLDNGKSYQGNFDIEIDKKTNKPKTGRIESFSVTGNLKEKEVFYLRLIKEGHPGF